MLVKKYVMIKLKELILEEKACDTAGIILRHPVMGVVLVKDMKDSYDWGIPKGKVEPGEEPIDAACRETIEEVSILIKKEGCNINSPVKLKATKKNSREANYYIYESNMKMAVMPTKSLEHEEVRWFDKLPENTDPRLKDLI